MSETGFRDHKFDLVVIESMTIDGHFLHAGKRLTCRPAIARRLIQTGKVFVLAVTNLQLWPREIDPFSAENTARFKEDFAEVARYQRSLSVRAEPKPVNWRDVEP